MHNNGVDNDKNDKSTYRNANASFSSSNSINGSDAMDDGKEVSAAAAASIRMGEGEKLNNSDLMLSCIKYNM